VSSARRKPPGCCCCCPCCCRCHRRRCSGGCPARVPGRLDHRAEVLPAHGAGGSAGRRNMATTAPAQWPHNPEDMAAGTASPWPADYRHSSADKHHSESSMMMLMMMMWTQSHRRDDTWHCVAVCRTASTPARRQRIIPRLHDPANIEQTSSRLDGTPPSGSNVGLGLAHSSSCVI